MSSVATAFFLRVAGIAIELRYAEPSLAVGFPDPVSRFEVQPCQAEVVLDVELLRELPSTGRLVFDSGSVWRLYEEQSGWRIECYSEMFGDAPYKVAQFNRDFTRGRILLRADANMSTMHPLDYPLDEVLVANLLARGRGLELHGCGVIDRDGRGHLFVGQSGAGKTTTARIWLEATAVESQHDPAAPPIEIVSDDRVIVCDCDGVMRIFGTPWHGEAELSSSRSAPLAGIYLLRQAPVTELVDLPPAAAAASLFGCTFPLFHDADGIAFTLGFLDRLVEAVPVRALRFTPDRSVLAVVRSGT